MRCTIKTYLRTNSNKCPYAAVRVCDIKCTLTTCTQSLITQVRTTGVSGDR